MYVHLNSIASFTYKHSQQVKENKKTKHIQKEI